MTAWSKLPRGMALCPACQARAIPAGDKFCRICVATIPKAKRDEITDGAQRPHKFVVQGAPVPKGRPRVNTKTGQAFTPKRTKDFEALVQQHAALSNLPPPLKGPVTVHLLFVTKIAENGNSRADIDNMAKAIMDAINGICYADDRQVRRLICEVVPIKRAPRTEIVVEEYIP